MQMVTQQFCLQGSPGALCNADSSPGYPVIQKRRAGPPGLAIALPYLSAHIPFTYLIIPCALGGFWKKIWVCGQGRKQACSNRSLPSEKWMIRASGSTGAATCVTAHTLPPATPSAIAGLCTLSATFLFTVHGRVRIHYTSSLCSQTKINYF